MWAIIQARKKVYRWFYERRVDSPGVFFSREEAAEAATEPGLSAALAFALDLGHLEQRRGHFRLTAYGMAYTEMEDCAGGES